MKVRNSLLICQKHKFENMQRKQRKTISLVLLIIAFSASFLCDLIAQDVTYSGFLPDGHTFVKVRISDGLIERITPILQTPETGEKIYISPGLIDTQVNGYASVSFNTEGLTVAGIQKLTEAMWKEGVTTFFPTIITNSGSLIAKNLKILSQTLRDHPELAHSIPGFFMEGPYISPVDGFRGAHQKKWVRPPDWDRASP
jgi:N-acetylglucosamine-6-phosphate deacetylase